MISENKFIKYEVVLWITGFIIRRSLANFVFPYSSMATYESSKDILLLLNKVAISKLVLTTRQSKEYGNSDPSNNSIQETKEEDGNSQIK